METAGLKSISSPQSTVCSLIHQYLIVIYRFRNTSGGLLPTAIVIRMICLMLEKKSVYLIKNKSGRRFPLCAAAFLCVCERG